MPDIVISHRGFIRWLGLTGGRQNFPTAAALVMARAMKRVAVKHGDFGLAKVAKRLHERAEKALSMRRSTLTKED
ncbi:MAG TPA: hypothetical protein VEK34_14145 [Methylocella sp.]|nr:hypothetical protein [Methylocella sp.]